jgi:hypothetical protein
MCELDLREPAQVALLGVPWDAHSSSCAGRPWPRAADAPRWASGDAL